MGNIGKRSFAALVLILGVAAWQRADSVWPRVFPRSGEIRFLGNDAYFHLRQTRFSARNFPRLGRWDVATHYPNGLRSELAGLYDLTAAAAALALGLGAPDEALVDRVLAVAPLVLGLVAILAQFLLVSRLWGAGPAVLTALLVLAYPASFLDRTLLGFSDHHAAELALTWLSVLALVALFEPPPVPRIARWGSAFCAALPVAFFVFTWHGAPIALLLLGAAQFLVAVAALARGDDPRSVAGSTLRYNAALLLLVAGPGLALPDLVMVPAVFPWTLAAMAGTGLGISAFARLADRATRQGLSGRGIAIGAIILAAIAAAAAIRFFPEARWITAPKTALVREHTRDLDWGLYWTTLGPPGLLALVSLPLAAWQVMRRSLPVAALIPVFMGNALVAMWAATGDYGYQAAPWAALLSLPALHGIGRYVTKYVLSKRWRASLSGAAWALLVLPQAVPGSGLRPPYPVADRLDELTLINDGWSQAMRWLSNHTPAPTLPFDRPVSPWSDRRFGYRYPEGTYGVLSGWDYGHLIAALGRRPVFWSQTLNPDIAKWLAGSDERRAVAFMTRVGFEPGEALRYAVLDARMLGDFCRAWIESAGYGQTAWRQTQGSFRAFGRTMPVVTYGEPFRRSMAYRLYLDDGDGLRHFRLVYRSPHQSFVSYAQRPVREGDRVDVKLKRVAVPIRTPEEQHDFERLPRFKVSPDAKLGFVYGGLVTSTVKVFERVAGARIRGRAPAGARVEALVDLASGSGRDRFTYRQAAVAGREGRFELTIPYATQRTTGSDVWSTGPVRVLLGAADSETSGQKPLEIPVARQVHLTESAVLDGAAIDIGVLSSGHGASDGASP